MQPLCSLDLTLLQHVSASICHPQVFHFLPKLLLAFTICHAFFPVVLFLIYVTVTFWLTLVSDLIFTSIGGLPIFLCHEDESSIIL
jgi:hypothetical protein